jgi:hypothetical protein
MGIRVHKVIGYGLNDLKKNDPRINWSVQDIFWDLEIGDFEKWLNDPEKIKLLRGYTVREYRGIESITPEMSFSDTDKQLLIRCLNRTKYPTYFHYNDRKTICLTAPEANDWCRYDDPLDYAEETVKYHQKERCVLLNRGIFPYDGSLVRVRDPKRKYLSKPVQLKGEAYSDDKGYVYLSGGFYNQLVGRWDSNQKALAKGYLLEHLLSDWKFQTPKPIIALILWSGIFTKPEETIDELKPMLYVYWS